MFRRVLVFVAAMALTACDPAATGQNSDAGGNFLAQFQPRSQQTVPLRAARLAEGSVVVAAPEGYCIDPASFRDRAGGAFALLASCRILSGGTDGFSVPPVIMTVTIGPAGTAQSDPSAGTLAIAVGLGNVARKSDEGGLAVVQIAEGGDKVFNGADPSYWRGAMQLNTRLVGLALYAPEGSDYAGRDGADLLRRFASRLRAQNPAPVVVSTQSGASQP